MKLSFWTIITMAISIAFGILAFAYLHQWAPSKAAADNYTAYKGQLETEAAKQPQAEKRVKKAQALVDNRAREWQGYVATRTPEPSVERGGINTAVNSYQLSVDTQKFRNSVQRAINDQVKKGGVAVVGAPAVPGPEDTDTAESLLATYYNYPGIKFPVVIFDFGTITVQGTYAQIMANVRSYKSMPRYIAVADGLQISGTSPHLTGTYNLSVVGFVRGKEVFPSIPGGAAANLLHPSSAVPASGALPGGAPSAAPTVGGRVSD